VTIEPRDNAMGFALYGSTDKALHDKASLHAAMVTALGGRAAEQLAFGRISSGAANDLEKTHELARTAIESFGFSERVGQTLGDLRLLSDQRRVMIEEEIHSLVDKAYADALDILAKEKVVLDRMAATLLERKELDMPAIAELLGPDESPALAAA
jgi:cell division protease FtsH